MTKKGEVKGAIGGSIDPTGGEGEMEAESVGRENSNWGTWG